MSLQNISVSEFTQMIASKEPVPGGGGASALVGSIGIALGDMVGEYTLGKKKYADVEADIRECMDKAQDLRQKLLQCIDDDAELFEPLSRAYGIPKDNPERDTIMEKCLKDAASVPFRILELACEAVELEKEFAQKGSKLMVSDAATGVAMCRACIMGAAVNVKVNTKLMKDRAYADDIDQKVSKLTDVYLAMADEVFDSIYLQY